MYDHLPSICSPRFLYVQLTLRRWLRLWLRSLRYRFSRRPVVLVLDSWIGRTGNAVQQLLVAILHAEAYGAFFQLSAAQLAAGPLQGFFQPFSLDFTPRDPSAPPFCFRSNFFQYTELALSSSCPDRLCFGPGSRPRLESLLSSAYVHRHIAAAALTLRRHLLLDVRAESIPGLCLHLRAGDVGDLSSDHYLTNPLAFYLRLADRFDSITILLEPGHPHVLLPAIRSLFRSSTVISSTVQADFTVLLRAETLATSGTGTFAIAAALLSDSLQNLYCSSVFMREHLNPDMIDRRRTRVHQLRLPGFVRAWRASADRQALLHAYRTESGFELC